MGFFESDAFESTFSLGVHGLPLAKKEEKKIEKDTAAPAKRIFFSLTLSDVTRTMWGEFVKIRSDGIPQYSFSYKKWSYFNDKLHEVRIQQKLKITEVCVVATVEPVAAQSSSVTKNETTDVGSHRVLPASTINLPRLNTQLQMLMSGTQNSSDVVLSSTLKEAPYPYSARDATERLTYAQFDFASEYITVPDDCRGYLPNDDKERLSLYSCKPERLLAIVECNVRFDFITSDGEVGKGTEYEEGYHPMRESKLKRKYHVFLRMSR